MDKYLNQTLMQASNLLSKGNINSAINIFDTLSYKYPKNGDVMHMKAFAYLQSNNIQKAISSFKNALELSPKNSNILLDYCNFLNTIGKKKDAYIILSEKINDKNDFRLYFLQGCIEMDQGKLDVAIESFKRVLSLNPNHKDAAFNIGYLYYNKSNFDLSEKVFKAYLKTFGDDSEVHRYLYEIYKITNKLEESLQVISKLCESD